MMENREGGRRAGKFPPGQEGGRSGWLLRCALCGVWGAVAVSWGCAAASGGTPSTDGEGDSGADTVVAGTRADTTGDAVADTGPAGDTESGTADSPGDRGDTEGGSASDTGQAVSDSDSAAEGTGIGDSGAKDSDAGRTPFGGTWNDEEDPSVCTAVISPGGDLQGAVDAAVPGDVICLRAGDYTGDGRIVDMRTAGAPGRPIVVRAYPGERWQTRLLGGNYGVWVSADHVEIEGLWIDQSRFQGVYVTHADYVIARFNKVTNVGQECMRFKFSDFGAFAYNAIRTCGTRQAAEGTNGEGIYVGSGDEQGDDTHGVSIVGNDVADTRDEGIELKGSTYDCLVADNAVHDIVCRDGGGIVVTTQDYGASGTWETGHVIRGNRVWNVATSTQWSDGNGINVRRGALVYNNVVYGNQHFGIRVDDKVGAGGAVWIYHNTLCDNGKGDFAVFNDAAVDVRANIGPTAAGNIPCDASLFVDAAARDYHLVPGTAAVDGAPDVGIDEDCDGVVRPVGAGWDFGAYELL